MMERKDVIFIADSLDNAHKFRQILNGFDVNAHAGSTLQLKRLLAAHPECDLVIYETRENSLDDVAQLEEALAGKEKASLLLIVDTKMLGEFRLPVVVRSDFVVRNATTDECSARIRQLLWPGNESASQEYISVDGMVINLATYQVKIDGEPVDLTYLEYALLAFLATHPGRTYSRDELLRRVWGFEYYGGSRTVDVHVRRIRAKLGPELAQRLETVRGVGYLWNS